MVVGDIVQYAPERNANGTVGRGRNQDDKFPGAVDFSDWIHALA